MDPLPDVALACALLSHLKTCPGLHDKAHGLFDEEPLRALQALTTSLAQPTRVCVWSVRALDELHRVLLMTERVWPSLVLQPKRLTAALQTQTELWVADVVLRADGHGALPTGELRAQCLTKDPDGLLLTLLDDSGHPSRAVLWPYGKALGWVLEALPMPPEAVGVVSLGLVWAGLGLCGIPAMQRDGAGGVRRGLPVMQTTVESADGPAVIYHTPGELDAGTVQ